MLCARVLECATAAEYRDLLSELNLLKLISHRNVIKLLGVCSRKGIRSHCGSKLSQATVTTVIGHTIRFLNSIGTYYYYHHQS